MDIKRIIREEIDDWDFVRDTELPRVGVGHMFYFPTINSDGSNRSIFIVTNTYVDTFFERNENNVLVPIRVRMVEYKQESGMGTLQMRTGRATEEKFQELLVKLNATPSLMNKDIYGKHEE